MGINHASVKTEPEEGDGSETNSHTNISFISAPSVLRTQYTFPRVGADYFVIDGLSVGAALGWLHSTGEQEEEDASGETEKNDLPTYDGILFAPRVGYALMFQKMLGIWPRGGVTYVSFSSETDAVEVSGNHLALTLEVPFVISPVEHVAFTVGPTLDLGISGGTEADPDGPGPTVENDSKATEIGLNAGVTVWF
jgi:hypothetical protein